ncbi:nucleotidyltransferase substrate binding protein, HI0074 family [Cyclobacterium lianum]|uniref:Nucleotidyltransferase substrate binding protein, HI0074 family n=1 Tax=Cyclobacterium lianum TaxID=388280 RepID=A0A1M7PX45_9BACT|nr:nucleotidyltransferase substrate binding protein [Cyclobacterium lianum]SHN22196.1 nucleotidyltransferase substrate binding protein, HI0074 family [Cyclobacterium lianum]
MENDVRWKQRFSNYRKALKQLEAAVRLANTRELSQLEKQGLIQSFEYTHELAWLVMKDFFFYQGNPEIRGPRDATREAFKNGLIENEEIWMDMIKSRNRSSHTYNEEIAAEIAQKIAAQYFKDFADFMAKMEEIDLEKR